MISKVLLGPEKYHIFQIVLLENFVDFNTFFPKNQWSLTSCTYLTAHHYRLRILAIFNNGRGFWSLSSPYPIILVIIRLLYGEKLLICEKVPFPIVDWRPNNRRPLQLTATFKPNALVLICQELNFLELIRFEIELVFTHQLYRFTFDSVSRAIFIMGTLELRLTHFWGIWQLMGVFFWRFFFPLPGRRLSSLNRQISSEIVCLGTHKRLTILHEKVLNSRACVWLLF